MSAPTLWEEGRMSGGRVTRLAVLAGALFLGIDLLITGHPSPIFDIGFVLVCVGAALAVRPRDFFVIGVLPPLLLLGLMTVTASIHRAWVAQAGDGVLQAVVSGLAHHASGLLAAYLLTLAILAIRQRVRRRRITSARDRRVAADYADATARVHSNRAGSPAPTRSTTGAPSERSTTVVGSDPHSPESITASSH